MNISAYPEFLFVSNIVLMTALFFSILYILNRRKKYKLLCLSFVDHVKALESLVELRTNLTKDLANLVYKTAIVDFPFFDGELLLRHEIATDNKNIFQLSALSLAKNKKFILCFQGIDKIVYTTPLTWDHDTIYGVSREDMANAKSADPALRQRLGADNDTFVLYFDSPTIFIDSMKIGAYAKSEADVKEGMYMFKTLD